MLEDIAVRTTLCTMYSPLFEMVYGGIQFNTIANASAPSTSPTRLRGCYPQLRSTILASHPNQCEREASRQQVSRRVKGLTVPAKRSPQQYTQDLRNNDSTDRENNQDLPKYETPGGFRKENMYSLTQMFSL